MTVTSSGLRRFWERLDTFDLSLISLVAGYTFLISVGFVIGNIYLILDGLAVLFSLFVFLGGIVAVHSFRRSARHESLRLSDRQFVVISLSIIGSLALSLWIGPWTLIMGLLFVPAIVTVVFAMAFKNKAEKPEYKRLGRDLARSWS